jgi:HD-like signal output (HDOD) protein
MNENLDLRLKNYITLMPSLPTSVCKVMEICDEPLVNPADLNQVISLDPVLTGKVLKLINSAYYGLNQPMTNMVRAIIMLGINTVKNLAFSSAVIASLMNSKDPHGLDMEDFWRHSLCVGVSSKLLARERGIDAGMLEEYFTAGLLHDIGKIPLNQILAKEYLLTVNDADKEQIDLYRVEDRDLGVNHCAIGDMIVKAWKLTGAVADVIVYHHSYQEYAGADKDILFNVAAANYFAVTAKIGFSGDKQPENIPPQVWETLRAGPGDIDAIASEVTGEIEKAKIFHKL